MGKTIKLEVKMAGQYLIPKGKKVTFTFDEKQMLYYAGSDGEIFGLAQYLRKGKPAQLKQLGTSFCGCVVKAFPENGG
ncbi:MAG: hypothetical protein ACLSFZ_00605 [Frisingicoccus sp.]